MIRRLAARYALALALGLALLALSAAPALADPGTPDDLLNKVGFKQKLNQQVPLDLRFRDENGQTVRFGQYFRDKPVVLMLGYLGCPNLCSLVSHGMAASFNQITLNIGTDFNVVSVSIDPKETPEIALSKKTEYLRDYNRPGADAGWHFLTGDQADIKRLTDAVGFRYAYDPAIKQFAHPAGLIVLTPKGTISRYFYGIEYKPNDLRLGLVEASAGKVGTPVDQFLLRCYHYDPIKGKYSFAITAALRIGGLLTAGALGSVVLIWLRREKRARG